MKGCTMNPEEFLIPMTLFLATGAVLIVWLMTRHKERLAIVEKGLSIDEIKAMHVREVRRDPLSSLKWGLLFLLAGIAIMLGNFLHVQYNVDEGVIVGLVCFFVGIGLVIFYGVAAKKLKDTP
jgi:hypothetical protein